MAIAFALSDMTKLADSDSRNQHSVGIYQYRCRCRADGKGENCANPTNPPTTSPVCGDGGPALQAEFFSPQALYVDGSGNIFVADTSDQRIRVINLSRTRSPGSGLPDPCRKYPDGRRERLGLQ